MKNLRPWLATLSLAACSLLPITAQAQFGGDRGGDRDRGDRGGDRGDRGSDRGGRGGFDPSDWVKRMDRNGNGMIEADEMSDRSRGFIGEMAKRANLDLNQPIPVDKLVSAAQQGRDGSSSGSGSSGSSSGSSSSSDNRSSSDRDRDRDRERSSSSSSVKPTTPQVMGFGADDKTPRVAGFDVPLSVNTAVPLESRYDTRVLEYVDRMLRDYDKNSDGFVDSNEWKEGKWSTPPEESDTNKDGKLSKAELCERIAKRFGLTAPPGSPASSSGSSNSSGSSSSTPGSSSSSGDAAKFRSWAEGMMRQYDKNRSGSLEKDEWGDLKPEHRLADTNNDGVITLDELTAKLAAYTGSSSSSSYGSSGRSSFGSRGSTTSGKPGDKKSYKFSTALDKLPKGLPDWFLRNDADADGQIAMVEYSASWSDTTAAEFQKYDLDGDGFITPTEVLGSTGQTAPSSSSSRDSGRSFGQSSTREPSRDSGSREPGRESSREPGRESGRGFFGSR
ncbi:hypothetical protein NA78x_005223 [Anatilimnocola sp. NA78]|uniref:hypothetical protein n=1 Tax=Anatilimnocola sp. NA78 TaxID=3415683 RepID=UPI003CE54BF7